MVSPLMSRYGASYERLLERHRDQVFIDATRMPQEGELFSKDSPTFTIRLEYIDRRVGDYLDKFRESPAYLLGDPETAIEERNALEDAITLYAMGGVDVKGVEACTRVYVKACKRPERRLGNDEPPTYKQQRKQTYHYSQFRPTFADREMLKQMKRREERGREVDREVWRASVLDHIEHYPKCSSPYCPYCPAYKSGDY
jgi:hypothetical protein